MFVSFAREDAELQSYGRNRPPQPAGFEPPDSIARGRPTRSRFFVDAVRFGTSLDVMLIHHGPLQSREMTESGEAPLVYSI
jgi:hypothetical protein